MNNNINLSEQNNLQQNNSVNNQGSFISLQRMSQEKDITLDGIQEPLLQNSINEQQDNNDIPPQQSCWQSMLIKLGLALPPSLPRKIQFDTQDVTPDSKIENIVKNQKYSMITFIPVVLFNQFKFFQNMFFLLIAVTQFFDVLKVGLLFTYVAPLFLVLFLTMLKEAYDDYKRYRRDKEANQFQYPVLQKDGSFVNTQSMKLKVGDVIEINANQRIPADIVLLKTQDDNGQVFIRTDQLDGETDWKLRKSIKRIQQSVENIEDAGSILSMNAYVYADKPILDIYEFTGLFSQTTDGQEIKESLKLENTLWANTVLASGKILGMLIYSGKETRMAMNSRQPRSKIGRLDMECNTLSKLLFLMMLFLSALLVILNGQGLSWYILVQLTRYLILLSSIIPISMRVNLDFAKLVYCYKINQDKDIEGTIARNSTIPEELGRIQYLLTDKTGTLTQNDMIFKRLSLENINFTHEDTQEISQKVLEQCQQHNGPIADLDTILAKQKERKGKKKVQIKRHHDLILRDLISALVLCHNVTPMKNDDGEKEFQASSPDEIALVKISESLGMELISRDSDNMEIKNAAKETENYQILNLFPFSSDTKRMGIVLKHIQTGNYLFYLKGADVIMKQFLPESQRGFIDEECDDLAREGLRTLVITQRYLDQKWYEEWALKYKAADELMVGRNEAVKKVVAELETDMEFLGITGVEDKLQENVTQTLENARNAGINIWMLTGDKIETAICISISSGIKSPQQNIFVIKELSDEIELQAKLLHFKNLSQNYILVIDGISLKCAMETYKSLFLEVSTKAPAVVCCRCSPTQKSEVVESIKNYTKKITAAIGDGGNDVGMITSADVGIGIVGKEGMQAALAADFSILKFCYLNKLLLWHGRQSYKRSALLSQFIIHRGLLISFIQAIFMSVYYFVALSIFNGMLLLGYATVFTMFPAFALIFDEDVDLPTALTYPPLYKTLQRGRELNSKTFCFWVWKATFQGAVIMLLSMAFFDNSYLLIETITFTAMIFTEYLLSLSELNRLHIVTIGANIASILLYILILTTMRGLFEIQNIMNFEDLGRILLIVLIAWLPLFLFKFIKKRVDPSDYEKIMKTAKRGMVGTNIKQ